MTGPLISVIIPVYNAAKFLRNAVNSVINQTYKNLEIILVDDNSSDDSWDICNSFDDPRIVVLKNDKGLGAAGSRNRALDVFKGEFVTFVDADDYVHPRFIELLYQSLIDNEADISCCEFIRTYKNEDSFSYPETSISDTTLMSGIDAALNIVDKKSMFYVVFWNKLYKRYIWETLRLPTGKRAEDFYTSYLFLSKAEKVAVIDSKLYYYFQQEKSVMHIFDDFSLYMEEALDNFEKFLQDNVTDSAKRQKYSDLSLIFRCDTVVEDYWKAYKKKDKSRMKETYSRALDLKTDMNNRNIPLRLKFRLFYTNLFLYRIGRKMIDIKEKISIVFSSDKEGRIK